MDTTRRQFLIGSAALASAALLPSLSLGSNDTTILGGNGFGTYWRAIVPKTGDAEAIDAAIRKTIAEINESMSPFVSHSELSQFNGLGHAEAFAASDDLCTVTNAALRIAMDTEGAFDPTVGPSVHRYGFGPITGGISGDYRQISISNGMLSKALPDLTLDLCGIAKGYAIDKIAQRMQGLATSDFLIEIGGEVLASGLHPSGREWRTGIEMPLAGTTTRFSHIIALKGMAVATSGDAVNGYKFEGKQYSHIIDPHTARPVPGDIASVSVLSETTMKADAYATALMVMGAKKGRAHAQQAGIPTLFLLHDGDGIKPVMAGGFERFVLA